MVLRCHLIYIFFSKYKLNGVSHLQSHTHNTVQKEGKKEEEEGRKKESWVWKLVELGRKRNGRLHEGNDGPEETGHSHSREERRSRQDPCRTQSECV